MGFRRSPCLVPGKTPPDASGSRPDSQYRKSSDVAARLSDRYVPRERCINQWWARRRPLGQRCAEVLRPSFSRNQAFTVRASLPVSGASRSLRPLRQSPRRDFANRLHRTVWADGSWGNRAARKRRSRQEKDVPSGVSPSARHAARLTELPFRRGPASFRKPFAGSDAAMTSLDRLSLSPPDFLRQRRGRSLSRRSVVYSSGTLSYRHHDSAPVRWRQGELPARHKNLVHNKPSSAQWAHTSSPHLSTRAPVAEGNPLNFHRADSQASFCSPHA
jgi:hypothetical protein